MPAPAKINSDLVRALFDYDYLSGALIPKPTAARAARRTDKNQWEITGYRYSSHRLIWIWHHPTEPNPYIVSFIDGDKTNTRIENLRAVHEHPRWAGHVKQVRMKMDDYGNVVSIDHAPLPPPDPTTPPKPRASRLRLMAQHAREIDVSIFDGELNPDPSDIP
jgi:hypothetical protein